MFLKQMQSCSLAIDLKKVYHTESNRNCNGVSDTTTCSESLQSMGMHVEKKLQCRDCHNDMFSIIPVFLGNNGCQTFRNESHHTYSYFFPDKIYPEVALNYDNGHFDFSLPVYI